LESTSIIIIILIVIAYFFFKSYFGYGKMDEKLLSEFYDYIRYYPAWIHNNPRYVWPLVSQAATTPHGLELILKDGSTFTVIQKDTTNWEGESCRDIELYYNKDIVSAYKIIEKDVFYGGYTIESVEFIKEGQWRNKIKKFIKWKEEHDRIMEERMNKELEASKKKKMNKRLD